MKISCDSCQSKFTVGDDKVAGNILRIRCKKCGSTLVVNGAEGTTTTEPAASSASLAPASGSEEPKPVAKASDDAGDAKKEAPAPAPPSSTDLSASGAVAARREGSEKAADLFAGVDKAGSEPSGEAEDVDMKLTGERGPSSVLFSLGSLTKDIEKAKKEEESKTTAKGEGSGLIDIRSLTAAKSDRASMPPRVEDIMNLSGGGAFSAALAPPDLLSAPAAASASDADASAKQEKGNNKIIFTIIGCAVFLGVAIVGAIVFTRAEPVATTPPGPASTLSGALAQNDPAPTATATTAAPAPTETTTAKEPGQLPSTQPGAGPGVKPGPKAPGTPEAPATATAAPPPAPTKPLTLEEQMRKTAPTTAPTTTAATDQGGSFDRAAASGSLNAVSIVGCKKPDGPTGAGHVTVTFGPSGMVTTAVVDGGDFPGTPVGGCIAGKYRSAHVPPFSGSPVKVGKSFNL